VLGLLYRVTQKNRTHKNSIESYKDPVNFKHFESVYTHSPKFQSFKSLRRKVMFFPNMLQMTSTALEANLLRPTKSCVQHQCFFAS